MKHQIPDDTLNSNVEYCIDEFVRYVEHRKLLRDWWFNNCSKTELAGKYNMSETSVKNVIYGIGDKILIKASKM